MVDKSPSQSFGDRAAQTEAARAAITQRLQRVPGIELRVVEAGQADGETDGTRLFSALNAALADVPPDRVAGAVFITDGRVHDVPAGMDDDLCSFSLIFFFISRLLALEDRFHDLEGHQARTTRSEQQKYAEYIVY